MKKWMAVLISGLWMFVFAGWRALELPPVAWQYQSPVPGAQYVSPGTALAFRQGEPLQAASLQAKLFTVTGNVSGLHTGEVRLSDDARTVLFYPAQPFALGETVAVAVESGIRNVAGRALAPTRYSFTIVKVLPTLAVAPTAEFSAARTTAPAVPLLTPMYRTHPEFLNPLPFTVTTPASGTAPGYIFAAGMGIWANFEPTLLIADDTGEPVYLQTFPLQTPRQTLTDFKKRTVNGQDYLTYHLGRFLGGSTNGMGYVLDDQYNLIDTWTIGNGYEAYGADLHEFLLQDNGHAWVMAYVPVTPIDLSPYGGPVNGTVVDMVIQEQDSAKNVVFEWSGLNHIPLSETYVSLATSVVDYIHTNAIEVANDGNILISNRSLSSIMKIDANDGHIIWRLGGKFNEFDLNGAPGPSYQHDIRQLPNGNLTWFDNGVTLSPTVSHAIEYALDEVGMVITPTWQWPDNNNYYSAIMGSMQRLDNGNTFINWATVRKLTEVTAAGAVAFEMEVAESNYRAFRYPWSATPAAAPRLVALYATDPTTATLYFAWNGATDITEYEIYAGPSLTTTTLLTTTARTGFETLLDLSGLSADTCVFQVKPRRATPEALPLSNPIYRTDQAACRALLMFQYLPIIRK